MGDKVLNQEKNEIINAYQRMEELPDQLLAVVTYYSVQMKTEEERHANEKRKLQKDFDNEKQILSQIREKDEAEHERFAKKRLSGLENLRKRWEGVKTQYEKTLEQCPYVNRLNAQNERGRGKEIFQIFQEIEKVRRKNEDEYNSAAERLKGETQEYIEESKKELSNNINEKLAEITRQYEERMESEECRAKEAKQSIFEQAKAAILGYDPEKIWQMYNILRANIPCANNFEAAKQMPIAVGTGDIELAIGAWENDKKLKEITEFIKKQFSFALVSRGGASVLCFPCGKAFNQVGFSKLIVCDSDEESALDYLRALEMNLFMSIPCGKLRVTMIDPEKLGGNFSMFSCLGDDDERIISTKIWSEPQRIKEQLKQLINQIEHVNQDCLRDKFKNIVDYNKHVGKNAEPLHALFVADFPKHFEKESCELLEKIVSSGTACGIYTFIEGNVRDIQTCGFDLSGIIQSQIVEKILYKGGEFSCKLGQHTYNLLPLSMPSEDNQEEVMEILKNGIKTSDRIIIKFDEATDELTKQQEKWFCFSDENGLDIPIGIEGAMRAVHIHLGGERITQHHVLISGTIGAGKSTLLHTIIMSILLRYSPEDVQIFLLDFKRGVEFKIYAESKLPNFRVISLDTEPEFGLAVLRHLREEQERRSQEFRDKGYDNIERYNEFVDEDLNDDSCKIPRIVAIIDEFHEIFPKDNPGVAKECEQLMEQIIRQGRAYGVHMILASQTLPDNLSEIYGQILNRVALQSTAESAQHILASDNEAVDTLIHVDSGKGIYNDNAGHKDANHLFRIAYFEEEEQEELLEKIRIHQKTVFGELRENQTRLLLSSIQDDNDNPLNQFVEEGVIPEEMTLGCSLYLGEEIAMENNFSVKLFSRRAQNVLILGSDSRRACSLYSFTAMSILFDSYRRLGAKELLEEPVITYFDFNQNVSGSGRNKLDIMNELNQYIRIFGRDSLMEGIEILEKECSENRWADRRHYVIFAGLNRARRLLDTNDGYTMPPKERFMGLVKDGPERGMNFIIWANEPGSFCSFYSEILSEFDYRLVYDLKEEEYEKVIKSTIIDVKYNENNIISYNPDEDNKRVRIYNMPLPAWFRKFVSRLEEGIRDGEL